MKRHITRQLARLSPIALLLLLSYDLALAEMSAANQQTILWSAPDRGLLLYVEGEAGSRKVCPQFSDRAAQPFCRTFGAEVLSVCGSPDELQLVLSNGEIFRVNSALLGAGGSFEPSHRPSHALDLVDAWMPEKLCDSGTQLKQILAVASSGGLWHFREDHWRQISK